MTTDLVSGGVFRPVSHPTLADGSIRKNYRRIEPFAPEGGFTGEAEMAWQGEVPYDERRAPKEFRRS